jgi:hypothetical protein
MCCVALVCVDIIAGLAPSTSTAWKCCTFEHDQFKVVPCSCLSWFISWSTRTYGRYIWSQPGFFSQLAKLGGHHLIFSGELSFCVTAVYQGDQVDLYSDIYIYRHSCCSTPTVAPGATSAGIFGTWVKLGRSFRGLEMMGSVHRTEDAEQTSGWTISKIGHEHYRKDPQYNIL